MYVLKPKEGIICKPDLFPRPCFIISFLLCWVLVAVGFCLLWGGGGGGLLVYFNIIAAQSGLFSDRKKSEREMPWDHISRSCFVSGCLLLEK